MRMSLRPLVAAVVMAGALGGVGVVGFCGSADG